MAPLIENVVMLQHATQFSYDRLKAIIPIAIISASFLAHLKPIPRIAFLGLLGIALGASVQMYHRDLNKYSNWTSVDTDNQLLIQRLLLSVDINCAVLASNQKVRGYDNLLFGRGIYELRQIGDLKSLIDMRKACVGIFIEGTPIFPDLPKYSTVTILTPEGTTTVLNTRLDLQ